MLGRHYLDPGEIQLETVLPEGIQREIISEVLDDLIVQSQEIPVILLHLNFIVQIISH